MQSSSKLIESLKYICLLIAVSLKTALRERKVFYTFSFFMLVQNLLWFAIWLVYFNKFKSINGWEISDIARMYAVSAFSFGLAFLFCGGVFQLGQAIVDGELDLYLGRPKYPLWGLVFREARPSGLGDILSAPLVLFLFGRCGLEEVVLLTILAICSAIVVFSVCLMFNCLPFYFAQSSRLTDQLLESFIITSSYPHNGFHFLLKIVLLSIIPAGFIAYLPVEAIRTANLQLMGLSIIAAIIYLALALLMFERGLRRYQSGNLFLRMNS